jgi:hypothetical protein
VVIYYLGHKVFDNRFLERRVVNDLEHLSARWPLRVIEIAEMLFLLRSCQGFSDMCDRLARRDLRATFFEAAMAQMFLVAGFQVSFFPPTGNKGEDFDFIAEKFGKKINVEVTALTGDTFRAATIADRLGQKRRQVPPEEPSVICCILPETWDESDINFKLTNIAENFLARTGRVNAVVFVRERHWDAVEDKSSGGYVVIRKPFKNQAPRHPVASLDFLWSEVPMSGKARSAIAQPAADPEQRLALTKETRTSEFFEWVDSFCLSLDDGKNERSE